MASAVTVGSGKFTYEVVEGWETLPEGYSWNEVAAVAVDANDRVYAFNRGPNPMIVFDSDGNFLSSWARASSSVRTASPSRPTAPYSVPTTSTIRSASALPTARCS